jgi:hypothetical protein
MWKNLAWVDSKKTKLWLNATYSNYIMLQLVNDAEEESFFSQEGFDLMQKAVEILPGLAYIFFAILPWDIQETKKKKVSMGLNGITDFVQCIIVVVPPEDILEMIINFIRPFK